MAVIRDMMPMFELFQPTSIDEAVRLLDTHAPQRQLRGTRRDWAAGFSGDRRPG
jgi:hypothetical protein